MSHGVHAVQHEVDHHIHHEDEHGGHKHLADSRNKNIALLIAVIALFLAFSETLGKNAQTAAISDNVAAADLWAFFQAKTIRITMLKTMAEKAKIDLPAATDPAVKAALQKQIASWLAAAARYESEEHPPEGRKQLMARARATEHRRDTAMARYHHYEVASAAFQIGIVLASAAVITSMMVLAYIACGLGVAGLVFTAIGLYAPHAVHFV